MMVYILCENKEPAFIHGLDSVISACSQDLKVVKAGKLCTFEQWKKIERIFSLAREARPVNKYNVDIISMLKSQFKLFFSFNI